MCRKDARQILRNSPAGNVGNTFKRKFFRQRQNLLGINPSGSQQHFPQGPSQLRDSCCQPSADSVPTEPYGPESNHCCEARLEASPITASPGTMLRPSMILGRSTTPTAKPARSYSPSAIERGHLGCFSSDQCASRLTAALGNSSDHGFCRGDRRASRSRSNPEKTAALLRSRRYH